MINNNIYYFYELFEKDDEKIKKDLKEKSLKKYKTEIKSFFDYYYNEIKKNSNSVFQFEKKFLEKKRQFFYSDLENGIFENLYNQIYSKYKNQYIEETKRNNEIKGSLSISSSANSNLKNNTLQKGKSLTYNKNRNNKVKLNKNNNYEMGSNGSFIKPINLKTKAFK